MAINVDKSDVAQIIALVNISFGQLLGIFDKGRAFIAFLPSMRESSQPVISV